jgi:IS30 family transposase
VELGREEFEVYGFAFGSRPVNDLKRAYQGQDRWLALGYNADLREKRKNQFGAKKGARPKIADKVKKLVTELIRKDWSPEQISGRLKLDESLKGTDKRSSSLDLKSLTS